jgi:alpha-N-arabinofuranosidase
LLRLCVAALGVVVHLAGAAEAAVTATIHADQPGARIDRHIYGQFAEHLGRGIEQGVWVGEDSKIPNTRGLRNDVVAALRDLHVPVVRWPGGCFADEYHWRDGIGPRASRPVTLNTNWGGVPETNAFGTHEFLDFVALIGADAYINGNVGTGSPREMAEWLQYLTSDKPTALSAERARNGHPAPWKIAYFAVGNETWGCGGNMRAQYYVDVYRQYATFLKTPAGARPAILASGGHDEDTSWTEALLAKANLPNYQSPLLNGVTFHYYTLPRNEWQHKGAATGFAAEEWISTLAHALRMEDFISANSAIMDKYDPQKKVAFDVDEWGTWYDPETGREPQFLYQQNTLRDAVVAALNFNIFHQHADRVRMANIAQMVNVLQAMILTQGPRMLLTPTYHVFRMFNPFQDATFLPTELQAPRYVLGGISVPGISISAARAGTGAIIVALVNLDPNKPTPVTLLLSGATVRSAKGEILSAGTLDAHNTFDAPDAIRPTTFTGASVKSGRVSLTLPAKSVLVLSLQ